MARTTKSAPSAPTADQLEQKLALLGDQLEQELLLLTDQLENRLHGSHP